MPLGGDEKLTPTWAQRREAMRGTGSCPRRVHLHGGTVGRLRGAISPSAGDRGQPAQRPPLPPGAIVPLAQEECRGHRQGKRIWLTPSTPERRESLSHPARLRSSPMPRLWPDSRRNTFNAIWRRTAIFWAPSPWRMRQSSSRKLTSRTQWSNSRRPSVLARLWQNGRHHRAARSRKTAARSRPHHPLRGGTLPCQHCEYSPMSLHPKHAISDVIQ